MVSTLKHSPATSSATRARPRRGVALLLVLGVIAAASILSWAMLSSASMRAQLDSNVNDATEAQYLAESGVSYAMYYLRYPSKSPVALTTGPYDTFYPGQDSLSLWSDAGGNVDIAVTNTAKNTFVIRSTSIVEGAKQTVEAEVVLKKSGYKVETAAAFNGPIALPSQVTITGLVSVVGSVTDTVGTVLPILGGSPVQVAASAATPVLGDISLVASTGIAAPSGGNDRTYELNGQTYVAERAPSLITGTLVTSRPALNPANVWYAESATNLRDATINGTLVVRHNATIDIEGNVTITNADSQLPALVSTGNLRQKHQLVKSAKLTVNGVSWLGAKLNVTGISLAQGSVAFNGALLMGSTTPTIEGNTGPVNIALNAASVANVQLTAANDITGLSITRWSKTTD